MSGLLDHRGNPIQFARKNSKTPIVRQEAFGQWAGRDFVQAQLPGGGVLQFDLSKLTLADLRSMRQHYQLGASLNVLGFILHQIDWTIESENKEAATQIEEDLRRNWTLLMRGMSQSFWAGFSPMALNFRNGEKYVELDQVKDLVPEECRPRWKETKGWAEPGKIPPKIRSYDGFYQGGNYIRPANSLWYPLLMENGDYYGRRLLANAFPAWYFSNLIHLFANRYFERFGEPLPVGRARFDDEVDMGGGRYVTGKQAMEEVVSSIRNRSVAVLPSERDEHGRFDYDIEYLESQMRGADFERYLNRLDEEMSLSVFTPILLFRTADVGSYNLGQAHLRIFQQMLNAIAGDMQFFIQNYVVNRLHAINWPGDKRPVYWTFREQGQGDVDTYKELMVELVRQERAVPDLKELAAITGITWEEAEVISKLPDAPNPIKDDDKAENKVDVKAARTVAEEAATRTAQQYANGATMLTLSHRNRFREALIRGGRAEPRAEELTESIYSTVNRWLGDVADVDLAAEEMKSCIHRLIDQELTAAA